MSIYDLYRKEYLRQRRRFASRRRFAAGSLTPITDRVMSMVERLRDMIPELEQYRDELHEAAGSVYSMDAYSDLDEYADSNIDKYIRGLESAIEYYDIMLPEIEEKKAEIINHDPGRRYNYSRHDNNLAAYIGRKICDDVLYAITSMSNQCNGCWYSSLTIGKGDICIKKILNTVNGILEERRNGYIDRITQNDRYNYEDYEIDE
jgi:hypothetical protein